MSLKRKTKVIESFSMASMTDVIFLLLIFFLVTSTMVIPNMLKVSLPSASAQPQLSERSAQLTVFSEGDYLLSVDGEERRLSSAELPLALGAYSAEHPEGYLAIYADESVPYSLVVEGINATATAGLRVVLATKVKK